MERDDKEAFASRMFDALDPEFSAHQGYKLPADWKPEPGAGRISILLVKQVERMCKCLLGHADAVVFNGEQEQNRILRLPGWRTCNGDLRRLCVRDGVEHQVADNLLESAEVADQVVGDVAADADIEADAAVSIGLPSAEDDRFAYKAGDVDRFFFETESAHFDARDIQQVV